MLQRSLILIALLTLLAGTIPATAVRAAGEPQNNTANSVSDCSGTIKKGKSPVLKPMPVNCIFLEEPIGGKPGYDLYYVECNATEGYCEYKIWNGQQLTPGKQKGPIQAILSFEPGKEWQSSFGLLYSYVGVLYKYLSGIILGVVVLMTIVGGIQMTVSQGDSGAKDAGRDRILHALMGMVLWFLSSLILYTINPTFFRF